MSRISRAARADDANVYSLRPLDAGRYGASADEPGRPRTEEASLVCGAA